MEIIAHVSQAMQTLLTATTEATAAQLAFVKRADRAKFSPSTLVQTLVYGWLANPTASVGQLAQMAARLGVDVSPQAIDRRFTLATATLLQQVLAASMETAIAADPVALPILQRFTSVRIHDSTTIGLPDALTSHYRGCGNEHSCGTAGLKCGVQLDVLTGALCGLDLVDGRHSDHSLPIQHAPMPAGSLRLADLGFYNMTVFKALDQAGVFWLTRLQSHSRIRQPGRKEQSILEVVTALEGVDAWEGPVRVGKDHRLRALARTTGAGGRGHPTPRPGRGRGARQTPPGVPGCGRVSGVGGDDHECSGRQTQPGRSHGPAENPLANRIGLQIVEEPWASG